MAKTKELNGIFVGFCFNIALFWLFKQSHWSFAYTAWFLIMCFCGFYVCVFVMLFCLFFSSLFVCTFVFQRKWHGVQWVGSWERYERRLGRGNCDQNALYEVSIKIKSPLPIFFYYRILPTTCFACRVQAHKSTEIGLSSTKSVLYQTEKCGQSSTCGMRLTI